MSNKKWGVFFGFFWGFDEREWGGGALTLMVVLVGLVVFFLLHFLPPLDMFL